MGNVGNPEEGWGEKRSGAKDCLSGPCWGRERLARLGLAALWQSLLLFFIFCLWGGVQDRGWKGREAGQLVAKKAKRDGPEQSKSVPTKKRKPELQRTGRCTSAVRSARQGRCGVSSVLNLAGMGGIAGSHRPFSSARHGTLYQLLGEPMTVAAPNAWLAWRRHQDMASAD